MFAGSGNANHMRDAIQVVKKYYEALLAQDFTLALSCFSDSSFEKMNTDIWKKTLIERMPISLRKRNSTCSGKIRTNRFKFCSTVSTAKGWTARITLFRNLMIKSIEFNRLQSKTT